MFGGYQASKLKPQLKMAITRLSIAANKKTSLSKQQTREIAKLLAELPYPKEEKARIKAEALIRDDDTVEAYEILSLNCDLLHERINLISFSKHCPADLVECISTLIWASTVVDIPELIEVRKQFRSKYGKEFEENALRNAGGVINERVASKLSVQPPSAYDVQVYLERIADEHGISWKPKVPLLASDMYHPTKAPTGHSVPVRGGSGVNDNYNTYNNNYNNYNNISPSCPPMSPMTMSPSTIHPSFNGPPNPFTVYLAKPMGIVFEEDDDNDVGHQGGGTNSSSSAGIFVAEILKGTPADSIGILQVGDQLLSVGGVHVASLEEALLAIQSCMNEKVKLMFYRSLCNSDDNEHQQYDHVSSELTTPETMTPYSSTRSVIVDDQDKDGTTIVYSDATIAKSKQSSKGGDINNNNNNNNNNNKASSTGEIPSKDGDSFDDLAARFARLRR
jgi:vacuolar protein sorting-associated protein IST1